MSQRAAKSTSLAQSVWTGARALLGYEETSAAKIHSYRLTLFGVLGIMGYAFYAVHDFRLGSISTSCIHVFCSLTTMASLVVHHRFKKTTLASHLLLLSSAIALGVIPMWDGAIHAPGLWMLVFLPLGAAFLVGSRGVVYYSLACFVLIGANALALPYFDRALIVSHSSDLWVQMRFAALVIFSGLGLASAGASLRRQRLLHTQTRELEQEIIDANVAEQSKSAFLAAMSHEIRMPVQGLLEFTHRAKTMDFPQTKRDSLARMEGHAWYLLTSLDAVLDLARVEAKAVKLREDEFSMSLLLEQVHERFASQAEQKGLELHTQLSLAPRRYIGDPARIAQILEALVDNAIRFSDAGQVQVKIYQAGPAQQPHQKHQSLEISVQDEGIGMNQEQISRVFGRFEQVHDDLDRKRGGVGLGLAIADRIAQQMGGALGVESQPGQGSTFTLTLQLPVVRDFALDQSLSRELGLDLLQLAPSPEPEVTSPPPEDSTPESQSRRTLLPLARTVVPFILVLAISDLTTNTFWGVLLQLTALCGLLASLYPFRSRSKTTLPSLLFLGALMLSITTQSIVDGDIYSQTMWSLGLLPVLAAYLINFRYAIGVFICCIGLISGIRWGGGSQDLEVWFAQRNLLETLALRFGSLLAHAGASLVITKGTQKAIASMETQQQSVLRLRQEAQQSNRDKDQFLARISQEFGGPIRQVVHIAQSLRSDSAIDGAQRELVGTIERTGSRLSDLIERSLRGAAQGESFAPPQSRQYELGELLHDVRDLFEPRASSKGLTIELSGPSVATKAWGDPTRILEILSVLLSNAVRFSQRGRIGIQWRLSDAQGTPMVEIEVHDSGKGIAKAQLERLFDEAEAPEDPHAQGQKAPSLHGSSALVRAIRSTKNMDGTLVASSEPGRGSRFVLSLPVGNRSGVQQAA